MATSAIAGLAAAGPALAAEEPPPAPPPVAVPDVPDLALPEIPVPEIPVPELVEPPVVVTHVDAENIDVSIRILSPGEDGSVAQESATTLISPASETGITEPTEDIGPAEAASTEPSGAVNTNVSIRVLSPGDRGEVAPGRRWERGRGRRGRGGAFRAPERGRRTCLERPVGGDPAVSR